MIYGMINQKFGVVMAFVWIKFYLSEFRFVTENCSEAGICFSQNPSILVKEMTK